MDKKEKIFAKLNIKDYTRNLEKILDKKKFSLDTKNLLLSMLYKIENGYNDYSKTKVQVPSKDDFIEYIFDIIENNCNEIIVAEFDSEASEVLKEKNVQYIIDEEKGKIIALGNDLLVLDCILQMPEHKITVPQEKLALQNSISNLLNLGSRMNQLEVIRDFNGWSWDIVLKEILNIDINIIFQTILYLVGYEFINKWIKNNSELADYIDLLQEHLKESFGEKKSNKFITILCELAIEIYISKNEEEYKFWKKMKDSLETELEILQNKQKFLNQKTKEKKEYTKKIEEIDKILNNKELLKKEYTNRNSKLPNKEKIFSISHLVGILEKEREDLLEQIKICNKLIDPKGYVTRKQEVEKKVQFLKNLDFNQKQNEKNKLIELCNIFLECFQIKIAKAISKQEVIDYIYELRYYGFLALDKNGTILKEIPMLKSNFEKCKKLLLEKSKKIDAIDEVTEDKEINETILSNIFDSKMIDLNHMVIETRVTDGRLYADYYDEKVLDTTIEIQSNRTVKLKKKTKLFI